MRREIPFTFFLLLSGSLATQAAPGKPLTLPNLELAAGEQRFLRLGGRIHGDFNTWDGVTSAVPGEEHSKTFLRRARLELQARVDDWYLTANYELANDGSWNQLHVSWRGLGDLARITLGQQKEDFGLEDTGSSNWVTGIEQAIPGLAFDTGHSVGLKLHGGNEALSYSIGRYRRDLDALRSFDRALSARIVVRPLLDADRLLHLGFGMTRRSGADAAYAARLGVGGGEDGSGAGRIRARLAGEKGERRDRVVELAVRLGAFHAIAERFSGEIDVRHAPVRIEADGWYLLAGWVLTGERRAYRPVEGVFDAVKPQRASGAWELFARVDALDVENHAPVQLSGGRARSLTVGLNWYLGNAVRVSLDRVWVETHRAIDGVDDGKALLARLQLMF